MKVAITGGAGFVGSAIVWAVSPNAEVTVIDDLSTGRLEWVPNGVKFIEDDAADVDYSGFDVVIHAAAVADIRSSWSDEMRSRMWHTNAETTHAIIEKLDHRARFVFVSSCALDAGIESPYAASKAAAEALVTAYTHSGRIRGVTLRLVSCVGPRYHHGHIADFVRMASDRDPVIRAVDDGSQRKSYVHVADVAERIALLAQSTDDGLHRMSSSTRWSWRDTVKVMRLMRPEKAFRVVHRKAKAGWVGDPVNLAVPATDGANRSVARGVAESLEWLTW